MSDPRDFDSEPRAFDFDRDRKNNLSRSISVQKAVTLIGATAGALIAVGTIWKLLDLPVPATREWVNYSLEPLREDSYTLLLVRRQLNVTELFQWQSNQEQNDHIRWNIERLKGEIAEIDRKIAARKQRTGD
jgi:hypothetical protein